MFRTIANATFYRLITNITYEDEICTIQPHLLGTDRDEEVLLYAWQMSGDEPGWRIFKLDEIQSVETSRQIFAGPHDGAITIPDEMETALSWIDVDDFLMDVAIGEDQIC